MRKKTLRMILIVLIAGIFGSVFNAGVCHVYGLEITGVGISDVSMTRATVFWETDEPATSQVEYGETSDYNFSTPLNEPLVTNHHVRLSDLKPETTYYVGAKSRDAFEHEAVSSICTFNTTGYDAPPQVKDVTFTNSTYQSVIEKPTGWFETGQDADIVLNWFGFNNSGGPLSFNHPANIATDGEHLLLADTWNNRILIWNNPPEGNEPPDVVLGQNDFNSTGPGLGPDRLNWPVGVATDGQHIIVTDTNNNRVMIWNETPTENGASADLVLGVPNFTTVGDIPFPPPEGWEKKYILWPWAVWTDGTHLIATSTQDSRILIWNSFPTENYQPADILLTGDEDFGTPRSIGSNGTCLVIGDHNPKPGEGHGGNFFWKEFPTTDNESYDFFMSDPVENMSLMWGLAFTSDGKFLSLGGPRLIIWNTFPENESDDPDLVVGDGYYFEWGDGGGIAIAEGRIYMSMPNGHKIVVFNSTPTTADQLPDFCIGAPDIYTDPLAENYFVGNPIIASDGKHLFAVSDFDAKMCVWKNLPDESGAKPDIVYSFDFPPCDIALHNGTLAIIGEQSTCIWNETPLNGELPDLHFSGGIGTVSFQDLKGVALDNQYFYLADKSANKIYVWEGIPGKDTDPKFSIDTEMPTRLSSDGTYLVVAATEAAWGEAIKFYKIDELSSSAQPTLLTGLIVTVPQAALAAGGHLFIADSGFNRVLVWNYISDAVAGSPPEIVLGEEDFDDHIPEIGVDKLFSPGTLSFDGSFLWVGEFKFSNRVLRFSVSEEISYDDGEMDGSCAYGGYGHAVRFSPPNRSWTIDKVKIHGRWYGEDSSFTMEVWDESKNTLQEIGPYNYSEFFSSNWEWVTIDISDIKVDDDFYVCFFADTRPEYGVSVGYDADNASNRSFIAHMDHTIEPFEHNWMIRVKGTSDITAPTISILSPENKTYSTSSIPLTFTVNEATSWIGYSLNNQKNVTIAGNTTLTYLLEGTYSSVIYANDTVSNMGSSNTVYFTINQTQTFHVLLDSINYTVTMRSNSTITDFVFNQTLTQISFNVDGTHGVVGFCNVTISKSLLTGNPWTITIEGEPPIDYIPTDNATHTFLYFTYIHTSTLHIIIQGTWVVPEFPLLILLPLFMIATLLVSVFKIFKSKNAPAYSRESSNEV